MTIEIDSMMSVIGGTQEDADGIFVPGEVMPSGKPVRAKGVTKAALMASREQAEGWFNSVKEIYEREYSEKNQERGASITAGPSAPREDSGTGVARGAPVPAEAPVQTLEAQLQDRKDHYEELIERLQFEYASLEQELGEALEDLRKVNAALEAISDTRST